MEKSIKIVLVKGEKCEIKCNGDLSEDELSLINDILRFAEGLFGLKRLD